MHGDTGTSVPEWFVNLPLSDPRCRNDSCAAFKQAHTASQKQISWASQFEYGRYTTWFYVGIVGLFVFARLLHVQADRKACSEAVGLKHKLKAAIRFVSYRRISGRVGVYLGLPSIGVLILILVSFIVATAMSFTQRPYYRGSRLYGSPPLGVRAGLMAAALIPLIIALGGKVNLVTMLTGIGHEKLNALHRWVGWIMFFLSTVHAIPFFVQESKEGLLRKKFYAQGSLEFTGTPTYAICFFLVAFSLPSLRRRFYETFAYSHILGAIVFFGLCFWHFANLRDSWYYLYGALAVWLFQLLGRIFWKTSTLKISENWFGGLPTVAYRLSGDMVKLEVFVPEDWMWRPGQHVFLRFPQLNPLDNHPFTIASIPSTQCESEKDSGNVMTFLVRAQSGSTRKLLSWLEKTSEARLSTIVEGPYGTVARRYENWAEEVVLVAGGNGISACLPYLLHLIRAMRKKSCVTRRVRVLWMLRRSEHFTWVSKEVHQALRDAPEGSVCIHLYVTEPKESDPFQGLAGRMTDCAVDSEEQVKGLRKHYAGRPDLHQLLPQSVDTRSTAVIACGPDSLKIDVSNATARLQTKVLHGQASEISLHTEMFDW
ncbi:uncharacterized protein PV09_05235 [Verruconis gallopava]|uniref:ferric-chelate reductase (NADPH) n=1 Tax=Verruconis gallopava TaxID=253628 RepID=A0A0D1XM31_9PEZI|nr:uncharacterized protein PV09_05235 [Verruconis gallopava]KIW03466.1 hypothetical protein PV09_05235 [Verruconis gallopava]